MADYLHPEMAVHATDHLPMLSFDGVGLVGSLFVAGLAGGFTHCAGMCGPFVLAQVSERLRGVAPDGFTEWARLRGAAVAPYHLGRLTTYSALGAAAGGLANLFVGATEFHFVLSGMLVLGALLFLLQFLGSFPLASRLRIPAGLVSVVTTAAGPLFTDPRGWRGYFLGVVLGFLPCGLLYGALAAAAGSGSALLGALGMAAFVVGTVPSLFTIAYGGLLIGRRWRAALPRIARPLLVVNAALLLLIAVRVLI
jgi:uncharacterized protein